MFVFFQTANGSDMAEDHWGEKMVQICRQQAVADSLPILNPNAPMMHNYTLAKTVFVEVGDSTYVTAETSGAVPKGHSFGKG
jgi:hypothetical protein